MTNPNKAKGDGFERDVRDYLNERGLTCERIPAGARNDRGDLWIPDGPVVQVKNRGRLELATWVDETMHQMRNAGRGEGWLVIKRRGANVARSYMVTELGIGWPHLVEDR